MDYMTKELNEIINTLILDLLQYNTILIEINVYY